VFQNALGLHGTILYCQLIQKTGPRLYEKSILNDEVHWPPGADM
jgi:hypothetical protein